MSEIFNSRALSFELNRSPLAEFSWHSSQDLSQIVNSKYLKFGVMSLDPGKYSYPYHFHRNSEELFVILSGKAILRKFDNKFVELSENDIVFFEMGQEGSHQLYNHTDRPCIYLDMRTINGVDICEYPDSKKICILPYVETFQSNDKVGYFEGENSVSEKWPREVIKSLNIAKE